MTSVTLDQLRLTFGQTRALDGVSLTIPSGSFVALLGPSGCGKTTLLRLIAGLERPDSGEIAIAGRRVAGRGQFTEPQDRGLGMVFQSYALWPHLTVAGNIGFGLNRLARAAREERIAEALALVGLTGLAARKPHELSGGQRQRVALARSLAARPWLLLLDEPLANLDTHLRQTMLAEFRRIHSSTGCTMIFVTHDQNEAMAVADLVGVMDRGRLEQFAPPAALFDRPASQMVARFVGNGRTLPVEVLRRSGEICEITLGGRVLRLPGVAPVGPGWLCLHSRDLAAQGAPGEGFDAEVMAARFENGFHILEIIPDLVPEAEPLDLRVDRPLAPGARIRFALTGGWVIPRAGDAALTTAARPFAAPV
ncbi:ABC transporter ATP-binding protein [Paracoccus aminophilus]|uniref:ABC-type spermidine/putrescine transport systems, ATPase components n=1 Tax=Paracoccus aminophilus JCM 7686 TaxID=1367847 RepID=S5YT40_PARAH|nr:ABC transporter ATP-binding protein [Paracoccus aminophilus]AGT08396.1 ABC-type spermidine/putrescine transport systems, ATPase components [Paracoccus aminophilus JCM 7686]